MIVPRIAAAYLLAWEGWQRIAEPLLDVRAQDDDRDRQSERQPELVAEHRDRVPGVLVVATSRAAVVVTARSLAVSRHLRSGRRDVAILNSLSGVLLMVVLVVHDLCSRCAS